MRFIDAPLTERIIQPSSPPYNSNLSLTCKYNNASMTHLIYLLIEFIDELVFGIGEAAWPLIRNDLHLNYIQIGFALSLPGFLANFIEPFLFAIGDVWKRRMVILVGGIFFTISLF